jgi:hypothetical protein
MSASDAVAMCVPAFDIRAVHRRKRAKEGKLGCAAGFESLRIGARGDARIARLFAYTRFNMRLGEIQPAAGRPRRGIAQS